MFTGLGPGDKNVFTQLGERKKGVHSQLGPEDVPRQKHISRKKSTSMSTETSSQRRKDAKELIRSYVTCSSKRQQELEEEWNIVDRASHRPYTRSEELYYSENDHDQSGHWKSKKRKSNDEDNLSQPWLCKETDPFTTRIRNFEVPKRIRMSVNVKTYDGIGDPGDHLKIFQVATKIERWAMTTWCHMFNSTFIGSARVWFDKLSPESIDDYEMLRKAFLGNYSRQKKYIKDPIEIHHIKQREGESTKAFMEKFKAETTTPPPRVQRRNVLAAGTNITNGDFGRLRTLNEHPDELHDCQISVNTQQYHRPPGSQENPGGLIYRSRNDKIPSGRRNSNNPQQYHNTSGMQNGSRNTKYPSTQITNGHGRNKSSNPPRVSGANSEHHLNVREGCQSIRKKIKGQAPDRNKAVQEEVAKLVEAEIMREVHYHDWLSNLVMCFLDAYKGYHQIQMAEKDEEKTAFHTNQGVFCYTKMLFGLKNAKETYQRLADKAFEKQIGRNLEVYVDDLGAFLGYVISMQGIKACPEKTEAAKKAFQNMKTCIAELPMVTTPKPKEELIMYLCAPREAVSAVLLAKRTRDSIGTRHEKAEEILPSTPDGADFIAEKPDEEGPLIEVQTEETVPEPWVLFTDGSSCLEESGTGLILTSPEGKEFTYALRFKFDASNNEAEYEALVAGLRIEKQMGVKNLTAKVDSRLPFYKWGIDISGPFLEVQRKVKFLIVAIDYFTKWIEAKPIATITRNQVKKFVWDNIAKNDEELLINLDILEERREKAAVRDARNKAKMESYYNAKVHNTSFRPGDFVYRSNEASRVKESEKLGPKWEGPYEVIEHSEKEHTSS
nr:reverse transcriptase domain-containing protein [Tanacetum cinerariifolium]